MTTTATTPTGAKLREGHQLSEGDLEVGRHFVHPETHLEYADFHAYVCGKDPLPHWRNARIKEIRGEDGRKQWEWRCQAIASGRASYDAVYRTLSEYIAGECARLIDNYDIHGRPFAAAIRAEHVSAAVLALGVTPA